MVPAWTAKNCKGAALDFESKVFWLKTKHNNPSQCACSAVCIRVASPGVKCVTDYSTTSPMNLQSFDLTSVG